MVSFLFAENPVMGTTACSMAIAQFLVSSCLVSLPGALPFVKIDECLTKVGDMLQMCFSPLETELSQESHLFPLLGEVLFHCLSVDVSSTANIPVPIKEAVLFKTNFSSEK